MTHMGSVFPLFLMLLLLNSLVSSSRTEKFTVNLDDRTAINIRSARILDLVIRDYIINLFNDMNFKTGELNNVDLPANLSGIEVDTARFRCGSLRRYGARMKEFHLGKGVSINPCIERVILIRQELGLNWSTIYYENYYQLQGYELITPIIGLLAYNGGDDDQNNVSSPNPFELGIIASENPIKVYFTNVTKTMSKEINGKMPYCANFEGQGKVTLTKMLSTDVCVASKHGHFGLVIKATRVIVQLDQSTKGISRWKVVLVSSVGAALGAFLLGLLLIAMLVKAKKRSKMDDMVRRAYEEEALQVSMVGHVRAPSAPPTRTVPIIERDYRPSFF